MKSQLFKDKVKQVIAHKTGLETREILDEMFFGDDLNLGDLELIEILEELEDVYKTDLVEDKAEIESVGDLIGLLEEKLE